MTVRPDSGPDCLAAQSSTVVVIGSGAAARPADATGATGSATRSCALPTGTTTAAGSIAAVAAGAALSSKTALTGV
ncbi:MAG: hypothetical protein ACPGVG_07740 [Mycobacterium sp.]